jgi:hypothetical protein
MGATALRPGGEDLSMSWKPAPTKVDKMARHVCKPLWLLLGFFGSIALLVVGAFLIYGFGAGYFYRLHLWLPTPLNFALTPVLLAGLIWAVVRFFLGSLRRARTAEVTYTPEVPPNAHTRA